MPQPLRSRTITAGPERAPNRAMLRAVGFTEGDFEKPIVGVANAWSTLTPCNVSLDRLARRAEAALRAAGVMPQVFGTITVSDGISMGTEGMSYSLVSREVIADSIETVCGAQCFDGLLAVGGCDKNMPGAMIAMARLDVPAVFVYGGTIKPGQLDGRDLTIVSAFEAVGEWSAGRLDERGLHAVECDIPARVPGACGGMYTANTMSAAFEALGMSLPGSSTMAAEDEEKARSAEESGRVLAAAIQADLRPSRILTRAAFENAIALVMALGGSTNAVLHLLAIAHAAQVPLALDDFEALRQRVPVLCDLKPFGRFVTTDLHRAGGIPQVLRLLLEDGLLHGDALTVTGQTIAETLAGVPSEPPAGQEVIRPWLRPLHAQGHLAILRGNLAEEGAWPRSPAMSGPHHRAGAGLRRRGGLPEGRPGAARSRLGTCWSSATRGPAAGPACARCWASHRRPHGRRPGRHGRPHHRRALLGRHPRPGGGPRGPRGGRGRHHRPGAGGRPRHHRRARAPARAGSRTRGAGPAPRRVAAPGPALPAACWPSTPGRSRAPAWAP